MEMIFAFYDFLGRGQAPTLAYPIAGVHSMLPPPPPPKKKQTIMVRGVARIWEGANIFFSDLEICTSQSDLLRMAKPSALLGGFGGMPPQIFFLNGTIWCVF